MALQNRPMGAWRGVTLALIILSTGLAGLFSWSLHRKPDPVPEVPMMKSDSALPDICRMAAHEGAGYFVCTVDPALHRIALFHLDADGQPFGNVPKFLLAMASENTTPLMTMNGGMYHMDLGPVGLLVEEGQEKSPLTLGDGDGNFFLKPNGVFYLNEDGKAGVMESAAFGATAMKVRLATQSGPMLVIAGHIHPKFLPDGTSKYLRNGVGVRADGQVVFAISRDPVSLGAFARAFRDGFDCPDALFFDGGISAFAAKGRMMIGGAEPAGPIVSVFEK